ncbi:MAG TPA: hypothetical protein VNA20_01250 [Frankiaceae bacterium]|nr:hypothetical protein [Frankiaceae bacterium]
MPVEPPPPGGRWVVPAAIAALAAVPAAYLLLRPDTREEAAPLRGQYLAAHRGGMQMSQFGEGEYGTISKLHVLVPDVAVRSVTPLDGTGAEVRHTVAAVEKDILVAQEVLYGMRSARPDPLPVQPGDDLQLLLRLRPDCANAAPATAVRITLTVRGQPAEQVVAFTPELRARHAERTHGVCTER